MLLWKKWAWTYKSSQVLSKIAGELERQIKPRFEFDVRILNIVPIEFQFEVIRKEHTTFSRIKSGRIDYESEIISTHLNLKYMYDFLDKEFLASA